MSKRRNTKGKEAAARDALVRALKELDILGYIPVETTRIVHSKIDKVTK